jgi:CheY-like chemotaxis protein
MMPVMGGAELITRLRGDPVTAGIPIIAASADIQLADAADIAFPKPYPLAQLLAAADALIAQKAAHR